jgi:hypothetical protein
MAASSGRERVGKLYSRRGAKATEANRRPILAAETTLPTDCAGKLVADAS